MTKERSYEELKQRIRELEKEAIKHKEAERAGQEACEYAENIVATVREPLLVLDGSLRVVSANRSFYQTFAVRPEETEGRFLYDLCNGQWNIPRLRELLEEVLPQNHTLESFKIEHDFPSLGRRVMFLNARRMAEQGDRPLSILLAIEDVTDRVRAEEEVKKGAESIKLFAYSIVHDLKSPSVGIYGLTRVLHKHYADILDEKGRSYCSQILRAAEQIAALVDKINVYISTREAPPAIETIRLEEILAVVREEFSHRLSIRQIKWSESLHLREIRADRLSIFRVIRNLVDNALKYGGDDLSEINVGCEESDGFHVLFVKDDGIGIMREDFQKIFLKFERGQTSMGIEGAGLGLAIVKEIAKQHGGEVWVERGPEKGTSCYVSIQKRLQPSCPT